MSKSDASQGRYYNIGGGRYVLTSDIDGSDGAGNCRPYENPNRSNGNIWNCSSGVYEWQTGIERWDQYYYAKYDNNSFVTIENPIKLNIRSQLLMIRILTLQLQHHFHIFGKRCC